MKNELSEALIDFYQKLLKPEIEAIKDKLTEHDEKFIDVIDHFDSLYKRLDRLDDDYNYVGSGKSVSRRGRGERGESLYPKKHQVFSVNSACSRERSERARDKQFQVLSF